VSTVVLSALREKGKVSATAVPLLCFVRQRFQQQLYHCCVLLDNRQVCITSYFYSLAAPTVKPTDTQHTTSDQQNITQALIVQAAGQKNILYEHVHVNFKVILYVSLNFFWKNIQHFGSSNLQHILQC
jgi:hypothetical protein